MLVGIGFPQKSLNYKILRFFTHTHGHTDTQTQYMLYTLYLIWGNQGITLSMPG